MQPWQTLPCTLVPMAEPTKRRVPVDKEGQPVGPAPKPETSGCDCPILDAEDWHEVESDWSDIAFIRTSLPALAGVPVGYSSIGAKLAEKALALGATVPEDAMLLLGEGKLRRPVLLEVETAGDTAGLEMPGGVAFTRLLHAPFGAMKGLVKETREVSKGRYGREPDNLWIWYLTCTECSEARDWETLFVAHYGPD